ncbi:MAG: CsbD family protein [Pseudomonadota bacterium]
MNWDQIEGNWKQCKGSVKQRWGKLTDDHLDLIAGKRDELSGKIQEAYGITNEEAHKQLYDWEVMLSNLAKTDKEVTDTAVKTVHKMDKD